MAYYGMKTPEQLQNEYNLALNNYRNMYDKANQVQMMNNNLMNFGNTPPIQNTQINLNNGGEYKYVNNYEEVLNASTRLDGTATLFVNFSNGIIWSKKFINGNHEIQTFKFYPLVNSEIKEDEQKQDIDKIEITKDDFNKLLSRLEKLENKEAQKDEYSTIDENSKINN